MHWGTEVRATELAPGVRQHSREFILVFHRQNERRGNEQEAAWKSRHLVQDGGIVGDESEGASERRAADLRRQPLSDAVDVRQAPPGSPAAWCRAGIRPRAVGLPPSPFRCCRSWFSYLVHAPARRRRGRKGKRR